MNFWCLMRLNICNSMYLSLIWCIGICISQSSVLSIFKWLKYQTINQIHLNSAHFLIWIVLVKWGIDRGRMVSFSTCLLILTLISNCYFEIIFICSWYKLCVCIQCINLVSNNFLLLFFPFEIYCQYLIHSASYIKIFLNEIFLRSRLNMNFQFIFVSGTLSSTLALAILRSNDD